MENFHREKGFNASQRADPKLMSFMNNLAHFTIDTLEDLIRENFFSVDDYVDVKFIGSFSENFMILFQFYMSLITHQDFHHIYFKLQIMMKISNKFPHNISVSSTREVFSFEPIFTDELGLCFTFNSRISAFLSPK